MIFNIGMLLAFIVLFLSICSIDEVSDEEECCVIRLKRYSSPKSR